MDTELIEKVAAWAEEQGFLLILDVQIGRGNVDDEVKWLLPFLKRPHVHLALDPEFAMPPGHGRASGSARWTPPRSTAPCGRSGS